MPPPSERAASLPGFFAAASVILIPVGVICNWCCCCLPAALSSAISPRNRLLARSVLRPSLAAASAKARLAEPCLAAAATSRVATLKILMGAPPRRFLLGVKGTGSRSLSESAYRALACVLLSVPACLCGRRQTRAWALRGRMRRYGTVVHGGGLTVVTSIVQ